MTTKTPTPEQLFHDNLGLVYHIAFKYKHPPEQEEDMIQEGMIALWKAAQQYDPSNGAAFTTYAGTAIARAYNSWVQQAWNSSGLSVCSDVRRRAFEAKEGNGKMLPYWDRIFETALSTEYKIRKDASDDDVTIGDMLIAEDDHTEMFREEVRSVLLRVVSKLDPEDRDVLVLRYGLDGEKPLTSNQELADALGIKCRQVDWRLKRAKKHLAEVAPMSLRDYIPS